MSSTKDSVSCTFVRVVLIVIENTKIYDLDRHCRNVDKLTKPIVINQFSVITEDVLTNKILFLRRLPVIQCMR